MRYLVLIATSLLLVGCCTPKPLPGNHTQRQARQAIRRQESPKFQDRHYVPR